MHCSKAGAVSIGARVYRLIEAQTRRPSDAGLITEAVRQLNRCLWLGMPVLRFLEETHVCAKPGGGNTRNYRDMAENGVRLIST